MNGKQVNSLPLETERSKRLIGSAPGSARRLIVLAGLAGLFMVAIACSTGGESEDATPTGEVTVPDEVSSLGREELERRLGRLLVGEGTSLAAPDTSPTTGSDDLSVEDILDALDSMASEPEPTEVHVTISPATISRLDSPRLTIRTMPMHGSVDVESPFRITYVPDGSSDGSDSFEYELYDGDRLVVAQVIEVRQ